MPEGAINAYATAKHFSTSTLDRWLACAPGDQAALLVVAEALRLGENQFRDIFDQAEEISVRRQCSIGEVLDAQPIRDGLARGLGRNEALRAFKQSLRRLRYPQLAAIEERLTSTTKALQLPRGIEIRFPENLEGDEVSIHLKANSAAQLREQVGKLTAAIERSEVDEMFRLLEGDW
jgi:hypothetical protein